MPHSNHHEEIIKFCSLQTHWRVSVRTAPALLVLRMLGTTMDLGRCQGSVAWGQTRGCRALLVLRMLGITVDMGRCQGSVASL